MQEFGGNTGDIDDDEGGGLVSNMFLRKIVLDLLIFLSNYTHILSIRNGTPSSPNAL
jgi:hypothetical protein